MRRPHRAVPLREVRGCEHSLELKNFHSPSATQSFLGLCTRVWEGNRARHVSWKRPLATWGRGTRDQSWETCFENEVMEGSCLRPCRPAPRVGRGVDGAELWYLLRTDWGRLPPQWPWGKDSVMSTCFVRVLELEDVGEGVANQWVLNKTLWIIRGCDYLRLGLTRFGHVKLQKDIT